MNSPDLPATPPGQIEFHGPAAPRSSGSGSKAGRGREQVFDRTARPFLHDLGDLAAVAFGRLALIAEQAQAATFANQVFQRIKLLARAGNYRKLWQIYGKHIKTKDAREQLDALEDLIREGRRLCLLCYEREPTECHRSKIAEIMQERTGRTIENLFTAPPWL